MLLEERLTKPFTSGEVLPVTGKKSEYMFTFLDGENVKRVYNMITYRSQKAAGVAMHNYVEFWNNWK
jgi:hypothetical protein